MNDEQFEIELANIRSAVDRIEPGDDFGRVVRDGQYVLCRLIYIISRVGKLTPERQQRVDDIVSDFDNKLRPALNYNGYEARGY